MSLVVVSSSPNLRTDHSLVGECAVLLCAKIFEHIGSKCAPKNLRNLFVKCGTPCSSPRKDSSNRKSPNTPVPEDPRNNGAKTRDQKVQRKKDGLQEDPLDNGDTSSPTTADNETALEDLPNLEPSDAIPTSDESISDIENDEARKHDDDPASSLDNKSTDTSKSQDDSPPASQSVDRTVVVGVESSKKTSSSMQVVPFREDFRASYRHSSNPQMAIRVALYGYTWLNVQPDMLKKWKEYWYRVAAVYGISNITCVDDAVSGVINKLMKALHADAYFDARLINVDATTNETLLLIMCRLLEKVDRLVTIKEVGPMLIDAVEDVFSADVVPWQTSAVKVLNHLMQQPQLIYERCLVVAAILDVACRWSGDPKLREARRTLVGDDAGSYKYFLRMICPHLTGRAKVERIFFPWGDIYTEFRRSVVEIVPDYTTTMAECSDTDWAYSPKCTSIQVGNKEYSWNPADLPKHWGMFWNTVAEMNRLKKTTCSDVTNSICAIIGLLLDPDSEINTDDVDESKRYNIDDPFIHSIISKSFAEVQGRTTTLGQFQTVLKKVIRKEFDDLDSGWEASAFSALRILMRLPLHHSCLRCVYVPIILKEANKKGITNGQLKEAYRVLVSDVRDAPEKLYSRLIFPFMTGGTDLESLFYEEMNDGWNTFRRNVKCREAENSNIEIGRRYNALFR